MSIAPATRAPFFDKMCSSPTRSDPPGLFYPAHLGVNVCLLPIGHWYLVISLVIRLAFALRHSGFPLASWRSIVPALFGPKSCIFPGKYKRHLNSALGGCSYRKKTPCFHDPFARKTGLEAKNQLRVRTVPADPQKSRQKSHATDLSVLSARFIAPLRSTRHKVTRYYVTRFSRSFALPTPNSALRTYIASICDPFAAHLCVLASAHFSVLEDRGGSRGACKVSSRTTQHSFMV
jgi:hypothetical protein